MELCARKIEKNSPKDVASGSEHFGIEIKVVSENVTSRYTNAT